MKYKPCCGGRCLLGACKTRDSGGCYCLCRLFDALHTYEDILKGNSFMLFSGGVVWFGDKADKSKLNGGDLAANEAFKKKAPEEIEKIKAKIKTYEVENETM